MSKQASSPSQWAQLWISLKAGTIELADLRDTTEQLDELGALLALRPEVSGVQSFDPSRSSTGRPQLCAFTQPDQLEQVTQEATRLLTNFGFDATLRPELRDDEEWKDTWKRFYRPLVFGEHQLLLRPSWIARGPDDPALEVIIDPGRAFGTGLHQSTQLCLERLCVLARNIERPVKILDLGCGSGVLAMAASRLFGDAIELTAVDVDPEATATAAENTQLNGLADRVRLVTGTLEHPDVGQDFDLVIANIRPEVHIPLAASLLQRVRPGGRATLSGILEEELDGVQQAYLAAQWQLDTAFSGGRRQLDTWTGLDLLA